ncbi:exopolyphosphatase [Bacillus phage TsarBomba]|uniref:Exopolyphosphatase n=1 Tax=Bacillus phage TsarBomba TaxID=1690456 RepID=A0A0K2D0I8_9CAUD|nr:exopolyphosphatase [Bacillus phage TsarBomba]ALA13182.1 exopolyphosphatase [Bacillus phage TsarBomba]
MFQDQEFEDEPLTLRLFVPPTFEGVTSVAVIQEVLRSNIILDIVYTNTLDFREYQRFQGAEMILVLGLAYRGYNLPQEFYTEVDAPFMDFVHISTYDKPIPGNHIISIVDEELDPIKVLFNLLHTSPDTTVLSKYITFTDTSEWLVNAINSYRTWTWEGNDTTRILIALYHASYKRLPRLMKGLSLQEVLKAHAPIIKGQMERMEDYIEKKAATVKEQVVTVDGQQCLLKVVFAEEYINELANELLNQRPAGVPTIVCVGRSTKGNDIFSIRTVGVHAGRVAQLINEGGGKESVATVFSGVGYAELMRNAIATKLV